MPGRLNEEPGPGEALGAGTWLGVLTLPPRRGGVPKQEAPGSRRGVGAGCRGREVLHEPSEELHDRARSGTPGTRFRRGDPGEGPLSFGTECPGR